MKKLTTASGSIWLNRLMAFTICICMLTSFGFSMRQMYNTFYGSASDLDTETAEIGEYIKKNSTKQDKIFAYMYGATLYQQAERKSGSRFISASVLLLDYREGFNLGFNQIFIQEMNQNRTKYVVVPLNEEDVMNQNLPLKQYFEDNYQPVKEFRTLKLLVRKDRL